MPSSENTDVYFLERSHITTCQVRSVLAFQTGFLPTGLKQSNAILVHWRSLSSMWTHASIYFSLHCALPASGLLTFAQHRSPLLSPFEKLPGNNESKENMLRFDNEAFNCDLLVSVTNKHGDNRKFKSAQCFKLCSRFIYQTVY